MSTLFDDLKQGLQEAPGRRKGRGTARIGKTYTIAPVKEYSSAEIWNIRMKAGMTQSVFAAYMGVSKKTVEAWEGGRTHPSGPAFRLLKY
ncbi:MAG: helix-turn-helix domain-containing protein [Ruminococcus sp.]